MLAMSLEGTKRFAADERLNTGNWDPKM